jgi:hypothetical protein
VIAELRQRVSVEIDIGEIFLVNKEESRRLLSKAW